MTTMACDESSDVSYQTENDTPFPRGGQPLTVRELEGMPDDGRRYELLDGVLVVSPAPGLRHQEVALTCYETLKAGRPKSEDWLVVGAPFSVRPQGDRTELQPDVLVAHREDFTEQDLPTAPALAVEVLSPSTADYDRLLKLRAYERFGVPSYWVIDPREPELRVFELDDEGQYQLVAKAAGDEPLEATRPFPVRIVPSALLGQLAD